MRPNPLFLALSLAMAGPAVAAGATSDNASASELDRVVVTATRTARALIDVPSSVDVIDRERMDEILARSLQDLFRYEPGIAVGSAFGRFGVEDIRIRGLGGNRVRIQTDGIAVPDAFVIGSFSDANRNFVDMDTLKRVEVVRGPTSSLYGSDALGGTVSFVTRDPADYLVPGKDAYFGLRLGYEGDWDGLSAGTTVAFGGERWSGMAVMNHRQGHETENMGDAGGSGATRTEANPQEREGRSLLAKLVYAPDADQRFRVTLDANEDDADTNVLTSVGDVASVPGLPPSARIQSQTGDDHQRRARLALMHEMDALDAGFADSLDWQLYRQDSRTTQGTREQRTTLSGGVEIDPTLRERTFDFDQRTYGLQANFHKSFATGGVRHDLGYGIDVSRTQTRQERDGQTTNLDTGVTSNIIGPDVFPVRDFPISRTMNAALYAQDEIAFADDRFRLVPAVRVDHYELDPDVDAIFAEDNPGVAVTGLAKTSVSPKLGAVWHFGGDWSLYGGYARGFRSPPYSDVNIGFTNLMFGYTAIANPDLKPETSDGVEFGVRHAGKVAYASLSGYDNRYHDFIESFAFVGFNDRGLMVFQSRNVSDARIRGVEFKGGIDFGGLSDAMAGWSLRAAAAYARGDNLTDSVPLDSVDPLTAAIGLGFDRDDWGAELAGRFAARKDRVSDSTLYRQAGYGVLDLLAHWNFAPGAKLDAGVFNLGDRRYSLAGDVPVVDGGSIALDRYSAPGRNLSLNVAFEW